MTPLLSTLVSIARQAADVVREVYETPFSVEWKGPKDPVTAADRRANELVCRKLQEQFPGMPVVAEESDPLTFAGYRTAERVFFVDPLDGTAEFVDRNGQFVVMIGLVEDTRAVAGVVCAPATGLVWAAEVGSGAWELAPGAVAKALAVSECPALEQARAVASRSHRSPALEGVLERLGCAEVVALGSAGLKGVEVARGRADVYVGPGQVGKRWDACAVDAIVTAAGGRFTDGSGAPFDYRADTLVNDRGLLATNGRLHDLVLGHLRAARV